MGQTESGKGSGVSLKVLALTGLVRKVLALQAWGLECDLQSLCEKPGVVTHTGNLSSGEADALRSLGLTRLSLPRSVHVQGQQAGLHLRMYLHIHECTHAHRS